MPTNWVLYHKEETPVVVMGLGAEREDRQLLEGSHVSDSYPCPLRASALEKEQASPL